MLATAIRIYQRNRFANRMVRFGVLIHHRIRKPETRPCPYAKEGCSDNGLRLVNEIGTMAALPIILSRMATCGPGPRIDRFEWCIASDAPCLRIGIDRGEWCIGGINDDDDHLPHYRSSC